MMRHLDAPLDEALDGTFSSQGILLHYDFPILDECVGLEMGSVSCLLNHPCINIPVQRFSSASRDNQDNPQKGRAAISPVSC